MLRGRIDRQVSLRLVVRNRHIRLHRVGIHHRKIKFAFGNVRGRCEGGINVSPLDVNRLANISRRARKIIESAKGAIGKIRFVYARRSLRKRRVDIEYCFEFLVFDCDFSQRFLRRQFIFGDHGRDGLAYKANLPDRDQWMILHAMPVIWMKALEHIAGEDVNHARQTFRRGNVDRKNARARKRAAKNFRPSHVLDDHVAGVDGAPRDLRNAISAWH